MVLQVPRLAQKLPWGLHARRQHPPSPPPPTTRDSPSPPAAILQSTPKAYRLSLLTRDRSQLRTPKGSNSWAWSLPPLQEPTGHFLLSPIHVHGQAPRRCRHFVSCSWPLWAAAEGPRIPAPHYPPNSPSYRSACSASFAWYTRSSRSSIAAAAPTGSAQRMEADSVSRLSQPLTPRPGSKNGGASIRDFRLRTRTTAQFYGNRSLATGAGGRARELGVRRG